MRTERHDRPAGMRACAALTLAFGLLGCAGTGPVPSTSIGDEGSATATGGESSGGGSVSGVASGRALNALSDSELASVCDYVANLEGGYDHDTVCASDGGTTTTTSLSSQSECIASLRKSASTCSATVGELKACFDVLLGNGLCHIGDVKTAPAACSTFATCTSGK